MDDLKAGKTGRFWLTRFALIAIVSCAAVFLLGALEFIRSTANGHESSFEPIAFMIYWIVGAFLSTVVVLIAFFCSRESTASRVALGLATFCFAGALYCIHILRQLRF
jgi:hypothetical protein